ncbi:alpha/beta fold hydrolase [Microbacterium sp. STN6]|uniref:alpha/beta hydrolase family protein n=1 Tax=Microbacterium sp. STN6 TaxID=2995588 RepID=UPI002260E489|nr:alpha/beta fold hydrolase [Microbacterium sp. STN6]MCX7522451.1 alpha/beta fold hydrolase [Microbacterium sp. STN6]
MRQLARSGRAGTARPGVLVALVSTLAIVGAATLAIGAVMVRVARMVTIPARRRDYDIDVLDIDTDAGEITLSRTADTVVPGRYGLLTAGEAAYARIGGVRRSTGSSVTRTLERVERGRIHAGDRAHWWGYYYRSPSELGHPYDDVRIEGELGEAPAWLIRQPAGADVWAIVVHGRGATREEGLRAVQPLLESGCSVLLVSCRNDGEAPASADGRYGLGESEWHDVEAAIEYAVAQGATGVVLMGFSMGGAIVLQTVMRAANRDAVRAVVLDSPVVDWVDTLIFQAQLMRLPAPVTRGAMRLIGSSWARPLTGQSAVVDLPVLNFVARADELSLPVLIMHSDDDGYVPATASHLLAALRPDIVTLMTFTTARHTRLWNYDAQRWSSGIRDWLSQQL